MELNLENFKQVLYKKICSYTTMENVFNEEIRNKQERIKNIDKEVERNNSIYNSLINEEIDQKYLKLKDKFIELFKDKLNSEDYLKYITDNINRFTEDKEMVLEKINSEDYKKAFKTFLFPHIENDRLVYEIEDQKDYEIIFLVFGNRIIDNLLEQTYKELGGDPKDRLIKSASFGDEMEITDKEKNKLYNYILSINATFNYVTEQYEGSIKTKRSYREYSNTSSYSYSEGLSRALITKTGTFDIYENYIGNTKVIISSTKESQEEIKKLEPNQKKILDTIIRYFRDGEKEFTNSQLAKEIFGKDDRTTNITEEKLEYVNNALEKLRTTYIELNGDTKDVILNGKNPFINLTRLNAKDKVSGKGVTNWRIEGIPYYYSLLMRTGGKLIDYDNNDVTKTLIGAKNEPIRKTIKHENLRNYLNERINNITKLLESPYIDLLEIYNLEGINAKTKKQTYDVRYQADLILDDLKKEYKKRGIKFTKRDKYKGKTLVGYVIEL